MTLPVLSYTHHRLITSAIGKALHELEHAQGAQPADKAFNLLVKELEREFPYVDWGWPILQAAGWTR